MGYYKSTIYTGPNAADPSDRSPEARAERSPRAAHGGDPATRPYVGRWPALVVCLVCGAEAPEGQAWVEGICEECRQKEICMLIYRQLTETQQAQANAAFTLQWDNPNLQYLYELSTSGDVMCRHSRKVNRAGRQDCCETCHECGQPLVQFHGELWCQACEAYR